MNELNTKNPIAWHANLDKLQGSQERRAKRIKHTLSESQTQLTPQFAKSTRGVSGFVRKQTGTIRVPGGFTIIELLIATAVFGTLLTIAIAGFTGIGNIFYKGVALTQTQSAGSQIIKDVTANIQTAASVSTLGQTSGAPNYSFYCIGGVRYTFFPQHKLDTIAGEDYSLGASTNYGLLKDVLPGSSCSAPCISGCPAPFKNPQEMLGNNMRLMDLSIVGSADHVYTVNVVVAYGDDDAFDNVGDPATIICKDSISDQRFCAVNRLSTSVYQGLHS